MNQCGPCFALRSKVNMKANTPGTARQNGFIYKVKTQAKEYQNLKVDTLRIQNSRKLKSYMVEFYSGKFLSAPTGIRPHDPQI